MSFGSKPFGPPTALTIAGSDSGGAAGLQADLKTFSVLGVYGMSAITVVTAQNSTAVLKVESLAPELVAAQIDAVLSDYGAETVKTGFIGSVGLIDTIAATLRPANIPHLVVDPVLVNHQGRSMFGPEVTEAYIQELLPLADLITPNRYEAALLAKRALPDFVDPHWLQETAERLHTFGPRHVLIKGGRHGENSIDLLFDGQNHTQLLAPWIETSNSHGSGDSLSAAVCAYLARGYALKQSVEMAHHFTQGAIRRATLWRLGKGHGPVDQAGLSPT